MSDEVQPSSTPGEAAPLQAGRVWRTGTYRVSREEMVEFARQWDPLPIHLEAPAGESPFSDVIASGLLSLAVFQRLVAVEVYAGLPIVAARGLRSVRFLHPVYPGDELAARFEVVNVAPPSRGRREVEVAGSLVRGESAVLTIAVDLVLAHTMPESDI